MDLCLQLADFSQGHVSHRIPVRLGGSDLGQGFFHFVVTPADRPRRKRDSDINHGAVSILFHFRRHANIIPSHHEIGILPVSLGQLMHSFASGDLFLRTFQFGATGQGQFIDTGKAHRAAGPWKISRKLNRRSRRAIHSGVELHLGSVAIPLSDNQLIHDLALL